MKKRLISALLLSSLLIGGCSGASDIKTAASTENFSLDSQMMTYYFYDSYYNFVEFYESYVKMMGLDTAKPLRSQELREGETWYDYFMDGAKTLCHNLLALNEEAAAAGITLSEAEKQALTARAQRMDTEKYGVGTEHIANSLCFETTAYKYREILKDSFTPAKDEILAYYNENSNKYQRVDYCMVTVDYGKSSSLTEDNAEDYVAKLKNASSVDEFKAIAAAVLLAISPDISDERLSAKLAKIENKSVAYSEGKAVSAWAFDAKPGDIYVARSSEKKQINVYMLTAAPYRNESLTANVRHILITDESCGGRDNARAKAEELFAHFEKDNYSMDTFALLALEYSGDISNYQIGGIYENLAPGNTVEAFNEWTFADGRKAGDTEIIESSYGCHIMYYDGDGLARWSASVCNDIVTDAMDGYTEEISQKYPITFDDEVIYKIGE